MSLRLKGSTSGYSELVAPAVAGDQTFTLPAAGGNVLTDASDLEAQVKTATNSTGSAPVYSCRAWVNFNGTGTVTIRDSGNVSSITDNGTGDYTVNFTTAMPDANYACTGTCTTRGGGGTPTVNRSVGFGGNATNNTNGTYTTNAVQVYCQNSAGNPLDVPTVSVSVFR